MAVPVAPPDRLDEIRRWCDEAVCLCCPEDFRAVGQFYADFTQVEDDEVVRLLRAAGDGRGPRFPAAMRQGPLIQ